MSDKRSFSLQVLDWPDYLRSHSDLDSIDRPSSQTAPTSSNTLLQLDLTAGEHVVIVGASGSGKSTLIKQYAQAQQLGSNNKRLQSPSVGLLLQEGALFDLLTVRDNLALVLRHAADESGRAGSKQYESTILNCFASLNLDEQLLDRKVSELSGGQMRRVAIARAILLNPQVMLYDEPDAGLDVTNLISLAALVTSLLSKESAAITVSHNPIYIARTATRVIELKNAKLHTVLNWAGVAANQEQVEQRQAQVIEALRALENPKSRADVEQQKAGRLFSLARLSHFTKSLAMVICGLVQPSRSKLDSFKLFGFGLHLSFLSGMVFFAVVGLMLGATTLAVVHLLASGALTGWLAWLVSTDDILKLMRGRYALYLGPAVGTMLFAARSGSLVTNWLGQLVVSRQLEALRYLNVPINAYAITPILIATVVGAALNIVWFSAAVWAGGVIAAVQLFESEQALQHLTLTVADIQQSSIMLKMALYSLFTGLSVASFALIAKTSGDQLNRDTTSAIVWSTILVALVELLIILY